jgi:hypothetical protein
LLKIKNHGNAFYQTGTCLNGIWYWSKVRSGHNKFEICRNLNFRILTFDCTVITALLFF